MVSKIKIFAFLFLMFGTVGCFKDLDTVPIDPDIITADKVYEDPAAYRQVLAKLYAGFAVSGQQGPAGQSDISGIDEGFGQYLRGYWYHQELTTDEAVIGWNDQTIKDFHGQSWGAGDAFIYAFYSRVFYQIALANEYLRETTDAKLSDRGVDATLKATIQNYRAEARLLRAISYWHALDLFRNVPFGTEADAVGSVPKQTNANELFAFIESELKDVENKLLAPKSNEYGRADQAAAWTLLAKLYLNAEVYINQNRYTDCLTYCEKVLNAGYELEPVYANLFKADNHNSKEIIFPVNFDGINTRTWGGMTFIIRAGIGGNMNPTESGVVSGWGGTRTTKQLVNKFPSDLTGIKVDFNNGSAFPPFYLPNSTQDFNALQTSNALTSPTNNKIYEGYRYFTAGDAFRFAQYPDNSLWWGDTGADGTINIGGNNIAITETGFYHIVMNFNDKTYTIEKQEFSIKGTATGGQSFPLAWDAASGYLLVKAPLEIGTFKFYINGDDTRSLGDNGADALLETGGAEITIDQAGGYDVFMDMYKPSYTYQIALNSFDRRGIFHSDGQTLDINDLTLFNNGYAVTKFKNVTSTGAGGSDTDFPDTDFPMFRLADIYLMAAEAVLRNNGDKNKALAYVNTVRERAYGGASGNLNTSDLDLPFLLDERARELYWECHRRTDLVRFGQFTNGDYLWSWKGGIQAGQKVDAYRTVFPIPSADLGANPNLQQNSGY